ncbi:MAG: lipid A biosynthesis acyltransferase [Chitinophagaceae bacterium]
MYYVVYGFLWLISLLPLRILYFLSDAVYGLVFYVLKYRRAVVMNNLQIAFPENSDAERRQIAKKFYHNLIDTFIETLKLLSVSPAFVQRHFTANWEVINELKSTGRKVQMHLGHNFNWEWANAACALGLDFPFVGAYMPMKNKVFNRLFYHMRSRFGTLLVSATNMRKDMLPHRNTQYMIALASDQNPGHPGSGLWFNFFGRPTPFLSKPAKNAIINDCAVVFSFIHKKKRGYYEMVITLVEENARNTTELELTRKFVQYTEYVIRNYPDIWLWSHRRWKHAWKEEYGEVIE